MEFLISPVVYKKHFHIYLLRLFFFVFFSLFKFNIYCLERKGYFYSNDNIVVYDYEYFLFILSIFIIITIIIGIIIFIVVNNTASFLLLPLVVIIVAVYL